MKNNLLQPIIERAKKTDRVIIVGAGVTGRKLFDLLKQDDIEIAAFFDNDTELHKQTVEGISIMSPAKWDGDCLYIIASNNYYHELNEQLLQLGIRQEDTMTLFPKGSYEYNERIDPCFYKEEIEYRYMRVMGQKLDLENPQKYTEKIPWLILNEQKPEKSMLADKYAVKEYVREKIGDEYVIPLLGHWNSFDEIDFDKLPDQFVLKCNHGSGMNIAVKNKKDMDYEAVKRDIDRWMGINYAYCALELHYNAIIPQVIAEEYIEEADGKLYDYKVHCFNGEPTFVLVGGERDLKTGSARILVYDFNWKRQSWCFPSHPKFKNDIKKPEKLSELYRLCKILCEGWRYVRVDFYIVGERLLLGEMTFTPLAGTYAYNEDWTPEVDSMLGSKIIL